MKRFGLAIALLILMSSLTACGGNDNSAAQDGTSAQQAAVGAQAEAAIAEAPLLTGEESAAQIGAQADSEEETATAAASAELASAERPVDLDLTQISGTVIYSQVYDMMQSPESYMGQRVKMRGSFSYFQDPDTKQEYFATIIADATACCAQGIEFVWAGEHSYPRDYPPLDTEITVTGTFDTYFEGDNMYVQLADAQVEWDG